jgi:phosphopantetheine adenylyltransferase
MSVNDRRIINHGEFSMKIGIIGGSMKPVTRGHWALIQRASKENDRVFLYVSTTDRGSNNNEDILIKGSDMKEVWERYLKINLPVNVELRLIEEKGSSNSPIRKIYELLGEANEKGSVDHFTVYSDPTDIAARFGLEKQKKYFYDLLRHGQVVFQAVERTGDNDVSATQMRQLLKHGMRESFISLLPEGVDGNGIWELLVLRTFVRQI